MDTVDIKRLATLKQEKADNERALANAIFPQHAERLQRAISSQERAIARLEGRA